MFLCYNIVVTVYFWNLVLVTGKIRGRVDMLNMPAFLLRKKVVIRKVKECGAVSEDSARTLREAGVPYPDAFPRITQDLQKQNILVKTKDGKYYFNG